MSEAITKAAEMALDALELAMDNLRDHGDNCFLHDEGEYNSCFCGKDSLENYLQSTVEALSTALSQAGQALPNGLTQSETDQSASVLGLVGQGGQGEEVEAVVSLTGPERVWTCTVIGLAENLPHGADAPMRRAVFQAFAKVTGDAPAHIFSGWGSPVPERYRAVIDNRLPDPEVIRKECVDILDTLPTAQPAPVPAPVASVAVQPDHTKWPPIPMSHCRIGQQPAPAVPADFAAGVSAALKEIEHWQEIEKRSGFTNAWSQYVHGAVKALLSAAPKPAGKEGAAP